MNRHKSNIHPNEEEGDDPTDEESNQDNEVDEEESDNEESNDGEEKDPWVVDVWKEMRMQADDTNESFLDVYKDHVLFTKSLQRDNAHQKVMDTFTKAQKEEEDMDFEEALAVAVDRRKFLIIPEFE